MPEDFRNQYAGLLLGSKKYCWIYGHGATWWHFTKADVARYGNVSNSTLPVDRQLEAFKAVVKVNSQLTAFIESVADIKSFVFSPKSDIFWDSTSAKLVFIVSKR
ncbi:hypothetical protein ACFL3Q_10310 [Planctomycetota bacterium]